MVTTNNHGLCYTNHSLEFEVKKKYIQMVIHLPKEKTWLLYFCCNKIMVNFYKGKIWLMFSIRIFLESQRDVSCVSLVVFSVCRLNIYEYMNT